MTIYIALLQGVNVGKSKRIAMTELKRIIAHLGGTDSTTVANSGNVVFAYAGDAQQESLRVQLESAIGDHVGQPVPVITRTPDEMRRIVEQNPYPEITDHKHLHVEFLLNEVADVLTGIDFGNDHLTSIGREIYLHLPNGMSGLTYDSRTLGKRLGSHHTSRNWNTVSKLNKLATGMEQTAPPPSRE